MRSQWQCLLQNVGEWQGSFTRILPTGEVLEDTPTVVSLQAIDNNQTMRQIVRRNLPDQTADQIFEYSTLGRQILFFDDGAFSQGSMQLAPYSEFGAEHGLIAGDRRLRLVQLFDKTGALSRITLIREKLPDATTPERPPLQVEHLVGKWLGEAVTLYPDGRPADTYSTTLQIEKNDTHLVQHLSLLQNGSQHTISSSARIAGSVLLFETGSHWNQVLLLPDGASAASPPQVNVGQGFFLELGWLLEPELRQRIIRRYNNKGEWFSLTLVTERKRD